MTARPAGTLLSETVAPAALPLPTRSPKRGGPWLGIISALIYAFLYLPLFVVILYSFSATKVNAWPIKGFTLDWYRELMVDRDIHESVRLSVTVGLIAASAAVVLGTLTAFALDRYDFRGKPAIRFFVVLPIVLPGIVTGVAMLSFFALDRYDFRGKPAIRFFVVLPIVLPGIVTGVAMLSFFSLMGWQLSKWTIIIGHTTFCITLILNNVVARLGQLPRSLDEASADLGAKPGTTFWRVTFPLVRPAILAGAILAFTLSFDEVIVTFFLTGRDKTLPLLIWGRLRQGISPEINAAATVIIVVSLAGVLLSNRLSRQAAIGSGR
jgi:spermidine/putrescine transport system permease protein